MIVVLVISIGFLVPKAAAPQPEFVTKIMHHPDPPRLQRREPDSERNDGSALP
jgi:hypothetical protein